MRRCGDSYTKSKSNKLKWNDRICHNCWNDYDSNYVYKGSMPEDLAEKAEEERYEPGLHLCVKLDYCRGGFLWGNLDHVA
jgi:hypothetical protein